MNFQQRPVEAAPGLLSDFLVKPVERRSFLIALALVALARAQAALAFTYSVDDYRVFVGSFGSVSWALVSEGRFGTLWLSRLFDVIGYDPMRAPLLTVVASIFLSVWAANVILRLWSNDLSVALRAMLLFVIAAHPYTSEIITFRNIAIYHILAFALGAVAVLISRLTPGRLVLSALVFAASLTFYQVPINYVSIFILFDAALRILRKLLNKDAVGAYTLADRAFYARIITFLGGFIVYLVCLKVATHGMPPHPFSIPISLAEVPERVRTWGFRLFAGHFLTGTAYDNPLVSKAVLMIPLVMVGATILELFRRSTVHLGSSVLASAIVVATPVLAGFATMGVSLFFTVVWLPPRVMASIGLVWAGVAVITLLVRDLIPRQAYVAALGVVVFAFIAQDNQIFIDQLRVGVRDHNLAIRIVSRLEALPNYSQIKSVAGFGRRHDTGAPIPTATHGFNDSTFEYQWAISPMLTELTGIPLRAPYQPEIDDGQAYCKDHAAWPAPEAVTIRGQLAIVCLPPT